jgi:amidophosphoribosyltransferase
MSDEIKHECGLAFIRLRKPLSYYLQTKGSVTYGLNKLYLLMEKAAQSWSGWCRFSNP